jgi:hypothetical protein
MVNRRDRAHLLRADPPVPGLLVPVTWTAVFRSPTVRFPASCACRREIPEGHRRRNQPRQAFAAYEHGRIVRWGPVSSGRKEDADA